MPFSPTSQGGHAEEDAGGRSHRKEVVSHVR